MEIDQYSFTITGGASGLGLATAQKLRALGARVAIIDIQDGSSVARDIGAQFYQGDITNGDEPQAWLRDFAQNGGLHGLINCAGVGTPGKIIGKNGALPLGDFERVIRVNLIGSFNMARLAAFIMQNNEPNAQGERGIIISTASVAAFEGQMGQTAYAASKGGIVGMTLPMARDLARSGIRVLAIAPGLFKTPLLAQIPKETELALGQMIPFPSRLGYPAEFAQMVVAMIENAYWNGEVVRLDGALRMPPK